MPAGRQIAMYIARQLTGATLEEIGREFGGRHHTTVLHSIEKVQAMRRSDSTLDCAIRGWLTHLISLPAKSFRLGESFQANFRCARRFPQKWVGMLQAAIQFPFQRLHPKGSNSISTARLEPRIVAGD